MYILAFRTAGRSRQTEINASPMASQKAVHPQDVIVSSWVMHYATKFLFGTNATTASVIAMERADYRWYFGYFRRVEGRIHAQRCGLCSQSVSQQAGSREYISGKKSSCCDGLPSTPTLLLKKKDLLLDCNDSILSA